MFDTFDILVPVLAKSSRLNLRPDVDTSEFRNSKLLCVDEGCFAKVVRASEAYTNVLPWTGAPEREGWTVLLVNRFANKASADNVAWDVFLERLEFVLGLHSTWVITCESDCESADLEDKVVPPRELASLLDRHRQSKTPISLRASPGRA